MSEISEMAVEALLDDLLFVEHDAMICRLRIQEIGDTEVGGVLLSERAGHDLRISALIKAELERRGIALP